MLWLTKAGDGKPGLPLHGLPGGEDAVWFLALGG
jgi:hypothetical protein